MKSYVASVPNTHMMVWALRITLLWDHKFMTSTRRRREGVRLRWTHIDGEGA